MDSLGPGRITHPAALDGPLTNHHRVSLVLQRLPLVHRVGALHFCAARISDLEPGSRSECLPALIVLAYSNVDAMQTL